MTGRHESRIAAIARSSRSGLGRGVGRRRAADRASPSLGLGLAVRLEPFENRPRRLRGREFGKGGQVDPRLELLAIEVADRPQVLADDGGAEGVSGLRQPFDAESVPVEAVGQSFQGDRLRVPGGVDRHRQGGLPLEARAIPSSRATSETPGEAERRCCGVDPDLGDLGRGLPGEEQGLGHQPVSGLVGVDGVGAEEDAHPPVASVAEVFGHRPVHVGDDSPLVAEREEPSAVTIEHLVVVDRRVFVAVVGGVWVAGRASVGVERRRSEEVEPTGSGLVLDPTD